MKIEKQVSIYKRESLLLNSTNTLSSPHTIYTPVFCVRVSMREEPGVNRSADQSAPFHRERSLAPDRAAVRVCGLICKTNEMQAPGISFCGQCGCALSPKKVRRGHPRRFCSDTCRARAWRRARYQPITLPEAR